MIDIASTAWEGRIVMAHKDYFESIDFIENKTFNVSRKIDDAYNNKLHWHPFVEILVCLTDEVQVTINFTTYSLKCNDILIVHPGDLHSVDSGTGNPLLIIQFPYELLTVMNELRSKEPLFLRFPHIRYDPLSAESERMLLLIKEFAELFGQDTPFQEVRMYVLLLSFFEKVGCYCLKYQQEASENDPPQEYKTAKKMAEACLFIVHNCISPLTLDQVAGHMGMSKSHFAHLFKDFTGMTFMDFLIQERIRRATALFQNPSTRIIDIAFDSGFSSISSFNRAFKKYTGLTPSQYRDTLIDSKT
jgi:AraC-like DNA-binding protein